MKSCIRSLLVLLILNMVYIPSQARTSCNSDYRIATKRVPHGINRHQLATLKTFLTSENIAGGWNYLYFLGDSYASMARDVIGGSHTFIGGASYAVIRSHWTVSKDFNSYENKFHRVAVQHFRQYLEVLESGYWPDSDQIMLSYISALRMEGMDGDSAFDVVWQSSILQHLMTWQGFVNLREDRSLYRSNICHQTDEPRATLILVGDFLLVLPQVAFLSILNLFEGEQ